MQNFQDQPKTNNFISLENDENHENQKFLRKKMLKILEERIVSSDSKII